MASTETCQLNETHPPKERSIEVFSAVLPEIKSQLLSLRHLHPPAYFDAVKDLSNNDLTSFTVDNLESVRVGTTAVKPPPPRHRWAVFADKILAVRNAYFRKNTTTEE